MKKEIKEFLKNGPKIVIISDTLKIVVERKGDKEQILCLFNPLRSNFADAIDKDFTFSNLGEVMQVTKFDDVSMGFILVKLNPIVNDSKILARIKKLLVWISGLYHAKSNREIFLDKYCNEEDGFVYYGRSK